jgi:hypothetical protein
MEEFDIDLKSSIIKGTEMTWKERWEERWE